MSFNKVNDLRRSTAVTTSGPGALVDARAGSAAVSGIHSGLEAWDSEAPLTGDLEHQKIYERRLLSRLKKRYFRLPPVVLEDDFYKENKIGAGPSLLLRRFPNWLQCPKCSLIKPATKWSTDPGQAYRFCSACTANSPGKKKVFVAPVRLVAACIKGHLDDFPWNWWVKHKPTCDRKSAELKLYSKGTGLGGFHLRCLKCNAERSMESAFNKSALTGLKCEGRRPWLDTDDDGCSCNSENGDYRALQRGASNLFYPSFDSALDIPPWTEPIQNLLNDRWDDLLNIPDRAQRLTWVKLTQSIMEAAARAGFTAEDIVDTFEKMQHQAATSSQDDIRLDEYRVFNGKASTSHREFEAYPSTPSGKLNKKLETLTRVSRLREVRVLKGFTRIRPPQESQDIELSPLSITPKNWLPAIEIRGEGVFFSLKPEALIEWSTRPNVVSRCSLMEKEYQEDYKKRYPEVVDLPKLSPRKLLIHSLSHVVMRQLTLECGYSSASLRERLYVDELEVEMNGILIYTGTADSDGTLGGLQARAEEKLFQNTLEGAIKSSNWCSSDPICIEGSMSPREMHSGASCHSCLLAPETSCELFNKFLDRALLIGTPEDSSIGFFSEGIDG
jgi:hypothetical protein